MAVSACFMEASASRTVTEPMRSWISSLRVLLTASRRVSRLVRTLGRVETSMRCGLVVGVMLGAEPARVVRLEGSWL